MNIINKTSRFVLNTLFPPMCSACKKFNKENIKRNICDYCFSKIKTNQIFTHIKSNVILAASGPYDNPTLRELIHTLKYNYTEESAKTISEIILKYINQIGLLNLLDINKTIIIPMPLHRSKLRERGFNQSELIAKVIGKELNTPVINLLRRIKKTSPQIKMQSDIERAENIKDCFALNPNHQSLVAKSIILIDDVYTSGATAGEAVKVLNKLKPEKIIVLVAARAGF